MKHALKLLSGAILGGGAVYFLDQTRGAPRRASLLHGEWPLAVRLAAGAIGGALAWHGTSRRLVPGIPIALIGCGLLGRALSNGGPTDSLDVGGRPSNQSSQSGQTVQGKTVTTTITIEAPLDRVFDFWAHYDQTVPHCVTRVKQITAMGEGRARWVLDSPGAADIIWNTVLTRCEPNKELAWETAPGSAAQHMGRVKFIEGGNGTTIRMRVTYNALAEALVRSMADSLSMDVKALLDGDLNRMKSAIESGTPAHSPSYSA
jgi:uncharacterized membrane protein